ncbi:hypothetical protein Tco_0613882 [Tanacetum coccineum]
MVETPCVCRGYERRKRRSCGQFLHHGKVRAGRIAIDRLRDLVYFSYVDENSWVVIEPMWAADRVVALTPGSTIIIPETPNEFAIKGNIIKIFYHVLSEITQEVLNAATSGIFLYKTPSQAYQLLEDKVLLKLDWAKNQKIKSCLKKLLLSLMKAAVTLIVTKLWLKWMP